MTQKAAIPRFGVNMWVSTTEQLFDEILVNYYSLNPSMSVFNSKNIFSLQYDIALSGNDMDKCQSRVQSSLGKIMANTFPEGSSVSVDVSPIDGADDTKYEIRIKASAVSNGRTFDLTRSISGIDSHYVDSFDVTDVQLK